MALTSFAPDIWEPFNPFFWDEEGGGVNVLGAFLYGFVMVVLVTLISGIILYYRVKKQKR